jgi:hypothetical protein
MVKLAEVMVQLSTVNSEKSPDQSPLCAEQEGVGVKANVGVNVSIGVADGANVGVTVGVNVKVGVGVTVAPNICPGTQLDIAKLKSRTSIIALRCFVFIILLRCDGRSRRLLKASRRPFDWAIVTQQENFVVKQT